MFDIGGGGANFFGDIIILYTYACTCLFFFMCVKHMIVEMFEVCLSLKNCCKNGWNVD